MQKPYEILEKKHWYGIIDISITKPERKEWLFLNRYDSIHLF